MPVSENLIEWVNKQLSTLLDFPVPQDLTAYLLSIENARDLEDYLKSLLNFENKQHKQFLADLLKKRLIGPPVDIQGYKKSENELIYIPPKYNEKKKKSKGHHEDKSKFQTEDTTAKDSAEVIQEPKHSKKKNKFVNLYSPDGLAKDVVLLKGRHNCNCQATKHKLINNCLSCGHIACSQEGSGPCLFCGNLVCTKEEQELLATGSKEASQLYQKLSEQKMPQGWDAAIQHRNRLLEYDRTSERRTKVIDDEGDYFAVNSVWLSKEEREKLQEQEEKLRDKRNKSQLDRKVTLDFAGRQVVEEDNYEDIEEADLAQELSQNLKMYGDVIDSNVNPEIMFSQPIFQDSIERDQPLSSKATAYSCERDVLHKRVQDRESLEMADEGMCLSMHQPWASLLVAGIKQHEGRTWYTSHRGRLWIAAAAKQPTREEIKDAEHLYEILKGERIKFPSLYPTGCLLGCVNLVDCLPQEDYRSRFPEGESDSPFVFICEDAQELPLRFPLQGKHKIYKLDSKIHQAAQKSLHRLAKLQAQETAY